MGFIVVHSSKLDRRKTKKLDRELSAKQKELQKKAAELEAIEFTCEPELTRDIIVSGGGFSNKRK